MLSTHDVNVNFGARCRLYADDTRLTSVSCRRQRRSNSLYSIHACSSCQAFGFSQWPAAENVEVSGDNYGGTRLQLQPSTAIQSVSVAGVNFLYLTVQVAGRLSSIHVLHIDSTAKAYLLLAFYRAQLTNVSNVSHPLTLSRTFLSLRGWTTVTRCCTERRPVPFKN